MCTQMDEHIKLKINRSINCLYQSNPTNKLFSTWLLYCDYPSRIPVAVNYDGISFSPNIH